MLETAPYGHGHAALTRTPVLCAGPSPTCSAAVGTSESVPRGGLSAVGLCGGGVDVGSCHRQGRRLRADPARTWDESETQT